MNKLEAVFGARVKYEPLFSDDAGSVYSVTSTNGKILFDAVVNNLTQEVKVCFPDMTEVELNAKVKTKSIVTPDGVTSRPSSDSVKSVIYPRIINLLADHYVTHLS